MIEQTLNTAATLQTTHPTRKVLTMVKNERMGGYVPKWAAPESEQQKIEHTLSMAEYGIDPTTQNPQSALSYSAGGPAHPAAAGEEFTFGDLVDMVNPLQHIPVVGALYRGVTGDDIKPIGQIIGGALFSGPMGAASGLLNTIVEEETGKDLTENAMAFVINGEKPTYTKPHSEQPEQRLEDAAATIAKTTPNLPASLLAFAGTPTENTGFSAKKFAHYKSLHHASMNGEQTAELDTIPAHPNREDITKLAALTMPPRI